MAAPHVAGLAALLLSFEPGLKGQVDLMEDVIEQSAVERTTAQTCGGVPGTSIPNNTYGWGRIDALAAMQSLVHELTIQKSASAAVIAPGSAITYTLTITHMHPGLATTNTVLTDTLPAGSTCSAQRPPTHWIARRCAGSSPAWARRNPQRAARGSTAPDASGSVINSQYGVRSEEVGVTGGPPVVTRCWNMVFTCRQL